MTQLYTYLQCVELFWSRHPALYYGLFLYLGCLAALSWHPAIFIPISLLMLCNRDVMRLILASSLFVLYYLYIESHVIYPPTWATNASGLAIIEICDIDSDIRYNRAYCKMKLNLLHFEADDQSFYAENIPCKLVWNQPANRPCLDKRYRVKAILSEHRGTWSLHVAKESPWIADKATGGLVEWRIKAKTFFKCLLAAHLPPTETRTFLEGVLIGEFHDKLLTDNLCRFSLQHITVVSGFHFSLIAAIFAALFGLFLPRNATQIASLLVTTAYLLFVGLSPSVLRAYIAVSMVLWARLLEEKSNGLNCLGLGLIICVCVDPTSVTTLSFQLSFLATFAILLLYPLCLQWLRSFFPQRRASALLKMAFADQVVFVCFAFFLASFALVLSVTIFMLPMSLYCFQQFPLMGIIYNCFFPFLVSLAVFILCLAILFVWFDPLCAMLFSLCGGVIESALTMVNYAPKWLDITLQASWITAVWLICYLCLISFLAIILSKRAKIVS